VTEGGKGVVYAVLAFASWGLMPLYWRPLKHVPALEILSHRVLWSLVFVVAMLLLRKRGREVLAALKDPRRLRVLAASAALIGANWGIFIWAVSHELVLQTSLGYFINPLIHDRLQRGVVVRGPHVVADNAVEGAGSPRDLAGGRQTRLVRQLFVRLDAG